jgi:hypothetical protein
VTRDAARPWSGVGMRSVNTSQSPPSRAMVPLLLSLTTLISNIILVLQSLFRYVAIVVCRCCMNVLGHVQLLSTDVAIVVQNIA